MSEITMYTTSWCPFCSSLKADLDRTETPYEIIDVEENLEAAEWVKSVNNGNRTVPTLRYSDDTHATNPAGDEVRAKYAELTA